MNEIRTRKSRAPMAASNHRRPASTPGLPREIMGTNGPAAATLAIWQLLLISGHTLLHLNEHSVG